MRQFDATSAPRSHRDRHFPVYIRAVGQRRCSVARPVYWPTEAGNPCGSFARLVRKGLWTKRGYSERSRRDEGPRIRRSLANPIYVMIRAKTPQLSRPDVSVAVFTAAERADLRGSGRPSGHADSPRWMPPLGTVQLPAPHRGERWEPHVGFRRYRADSVRRWGRFVSHATSNCADSIGERPRSCALSVGRMREAIEAFTRRF
jgi:hypothetical protein